MSNSLGEFGIIKIAKRDFDIKQFKMKMRRCQGCGQYTLKDTCPRCNTPSKAVGPARYSPQDPYGRYRRQMKEAMKDGDGSR